MTAAPAALAHGQPILFIQKSERVLYVTYDTGEKFGLTAELLRVESPSAEVQGHHHSESPCDRQRKCYYSAVQPVGNYAVRLVLMTAIIPDFIHGLICMSWHKTPHQACEFADADNPTADVIKPYNNGNEYNETIDLDDQKTD